MKKLLLALVVLFATLGVNGWASSECVGSPSAYVVALSRTTGVVIRNHPGSVGITLTAATGLWVTTSGSDSGMKIRVAWSDDDITYTNGVLVNVPVTGYCLGVSANYVKFFPSGPLGKWAGVSYGTATGDIVVAGMVDLSVTAAAMATPVKSIDTVLKAAATPIASLDTVLKAAATPIASTDTVLKAVATAVAIDNTGYTFKAVTSAACDTSVWTINVSSVAGSSNEGPFKVLFTGYGSADTSILYGYAASAAITPTVPQAMSTTAGANLDLAPGTHVGFAAQAAATIRAWIFQKTK